MTGTLHGDRYTFLIISRSFLLRMRNVSDRSCRENQNTHFVLHNSPYPPSESSAVYEITWKNILEPDRPQMTIWRMRIVCWTPKATDTHSQYVILITFPQQQWLHERASVLRYKYVDCLVIKKTNVRQKVM